MPLLDLRTKAQEHGRVVEARCDQPACGKRYTLVVPVKGDVSPPKCRRSGCKGTVR
jgi:hypothetical protein